MESIKSQTIEIYPTFWEAFSESLPKLKSEMLGYQTKVKQSEHDLNKISCLPKLSQEDYLTLEIMFNLYIFTVEESRCILNSDCDKFEQILQTMSIVSLWSIEFEKYLKNKLKLTTTKTNEIMTEILELSSVESSMSSKNLKTLLDEKTELQSKAYDLHIEKVKEKIRNLYLKLICY